MVAGIPINASYIAAVIGDISFEMIIVCERIPVIKSAICPRNLKMPGICLLHF